MVNTPQLTPPVSIPAESCLLGSMLLKKESLQEAVAEVQSDWFYRPAHRTIFRILQEMSRDDVAVDILLLANRLGSASLEKIGGREYLVDLVTGTPNADSISHYAEIIKDKYTKRKLIQAGTDIVAMGYDEAMSATQLVGESYSRVQEAGQQQRQQRQVSAGEAMASMIEHTEAVRDGHITPSLPTGFPGLDHLLTGGGFRPGNLILLAGRPGKGKSMVATDWARYLAMGRDNINKGQRNGVLFVSGEMTATEIMERHSAAITGVYAAKIAQGNISEGDWMALKSVEDAAQHWKMEVMDTAASIGEIAAEAKRLNSAWNVGTGGSGHLSCVIIDYLGLMRPSNKDQNREQAVGEMARECKNYAQSMNIPWIALHQLNRQGATGRPEMYQLRDSGQLEEHANTVILLDWNDEILHDAPPEEGGPWRHLLLRVAKQRGGISTSWNGAVQRKLRGCLTRTESLDTMIDITGIE